MEIDFTKLSEAELNSVLESVTALAEAKEKVVGFDVDEAEESAREYAKRRNEKTRGKAQATDELGEAILQNVSGWRRRTNRVPSEK